MEECYYKRFLKLYKWYQIPQSITYICEIIHMKQEVSVMWLVTNYSPGSNEQGNLGSKFFHFLREGNQCSNTRIYTLSSGPHITYFSEVVADKRKNF